MSAESTKRVAAMAAAMLDDDDPAVRSLAGSVLRQFEADPEEAPVSRLAHLRQSRPEALFWEGYWEGLWACQGRD